MPEQVNARNDHEENVSPPEADVPRAVIYLRVSTKEQAEMGGEAEGFSIPAQRAACTRKADALGALVEEEFVDRGESAKTANRPELLKMLRYLRENRVQYVIVHKVDRLARSRADDVAITMEIQKSGATLVSCSENIDETPSGLLLHGIMSSIAEFYSRNLASEVVKGMNQKVMTGGTVGKAPVGYLHVRRVQSGREVRTVIIDPERGPLVRWVFAAYATGSWTTRQLLAEVTERGLTSRPGPHTPARPLALATLIALLANPFYIGQVTFQGVHYPGRHEPLIDKQLFDRVQSVLVAHNYAGEKQRSHNHYLKGSLFCGDCGSRLGISNSRSGTGEVYDYFYCLGRQRNRHSCTQSVVRVQKVERLIARHYSSIQLTAERILEIRLALGEALSARREEAEAAAHVQTLRVERLSREREKLLQLHYVEAVPVDLFRQEQNRITNELQNAREQLAGVSVAFDVIEQNVRRALELAQDCHAAYAAASPTIRRLFNQAFFEKLYVHDDGEVTHELAAPFKALLDPGLAKHLRSAAGSHTSEQWLRADARARGHHNENDLARSEAESSNNRVLVEVTGLEPVTFWLPAKRSPN
jgi:site-specific DNA recombinase